MRILFALLVSLIIIAGCTSTKNVTKQSFSPELDGFINKTNLVFSQGKYWIRDIPETDRALGSLYKKVTKTIDRLQYTAYTHVADFSFGNIADSLIIKEEIIYSKDYTFKHVRNSDLEVLSMFSANYSDISEIKKKVVLSEVWAINYNELTFDKAYCDSSYYFVNRVYLGSSSDFGLQEVKGSAKFAGFNVGAGFEASQASNMHIIKEGALTMMLQPVSSLNVCNPGDTLSIKIISKRITPSLLFKELEIDSYKKNNDK